MYKWTEQWWAGFVLLGAIVICILIQYGIHIIKYKYLRWFEIDAAKEKDKNNIMP